MIQERNQQFRQEIEELELLLVELEGLREGGEGDKKVS